MSLTLALKTGGRRLAGACALAAVCVSLFAPAPAVGSAPPAPVIANTPLAPDRVSVLVDGYFLGFDVPPRIDRGRVLVPWRRLLEFYGYEVHYDAATETISTRGSGRLIEMQVGRAEARINGTAVTLDVPATVVDGRTLVPLRFVSEALGYAVRWDGARQAVFITGHTDPARPLPPLALEQITTVRRALPRGAVNRYVTLSAETPAHRPFPESLAAAWQGAVPAVHADKSLPMPPAGTGLTITLQSGTATVLLAWNCQMLPDGGRQCMPDESDGFVYLYTSGATSEPVLVYAPGLTAFIKAFPLSE